MASKYLKELHSRMLNLPAWLLVLYTFSVGFSWQLLFNIPFSLVMNPESNSCWEPFPKEKSAEARLVILIQYLVFPILFPLAGWIADTKIGRDMAIKLSLWSCWVGTLLQCISYCVQFGTCGLPANIAKYGVSGIAFLFLGIGVALFLSNVLAHGLDQLVYKSNTHIRAFVHWIVWGWFFGESVSYIAHIKCTIYDSKLMMITGLMAFIVTSIALCFSSWFHHKMNYSGVLQTSPYSMVYKILKYAWQYKHPKNRSAMTFWESEVPTRVDLGKERYGGPYLEEKVEDVKMLGRILLVLLSMFGFYTTYYTTVVDILGSRHNHCNGKLDLNQYSQFIAFSCFDKLILIIIPVLELLVYPLFPKLEYFFTNSLRLFGIAYIFMLLSLISIFIINISSVPMNSMAKQTHPFNLLSNGPPRVYWISFALSGLADSLSLIFVFEFICSQTPVGMSGMLSGAFWFIRGAFINIGYLLQFPFTKTESCRTDFKCWVWLLVVNIIICTVGLFVYLHAIYKYKQRKKKIEYDVHKIVEETFARMLNDSQRRSEVMLDSGNDYRLLFQKNN